MPWHVGVDILDQFIKTNELNVERVFKTLQRLRKVNKISTVFCMLKVMWCMNTVFICTLNFKVLLKEAPVES